MRVVDLYPGQGPLRYVWFYVWGPVNLAVAFVPLMSLNLFQFPSLLLLPFSKPAFRRYNRLIGFLCWGWWAWGVQQIIGLKVEKNGDAIVENENAIVVCNHQGMADILVLLCLAMGKGRLGDFKWVVKDVLKYVPGLGWGMLFLECVFIKRNWDRDKETIRKTFEKYRRNQIPLWLTMFPEGTRFTQAKLQKSNEFAKKEGLEPTSNVLLPRPKGFAAAVVGMRDYASVLYSVTIYYPERTPSLLEIIRGDVKRVQTYVKRIPIAELPDEEKELQDWIKNHFYEYDRRLEQFKEG